MTIKLRSLLGAATGLIAAFAFSSCAYDPYYASTSVGGSYSSGYGGGYGGGASSTSLFVSTGNPQWGYDPGCYSYYDYNRRCYYDPYIDGYYPVGYRPPIVYGVSHPYGWRPGNTYCRPPAHVSNVTITNYRNREATYRSRGYSSGVQARSQPYSAGRVYGKHPATSASSSNQYQSNSNNYRPSATQSSRPPQGRTSSAQPSTRYPSRYNSPVSASQQRDPRYTQKANQTAQRQVRQIAPPDNSRSNPPQGASSRSRKSNKADDDRTESRGRSRN